MSRFVRQAQQFPSIHLLPVVDGLEELTYVTHAGDGSGRLFVLERTGRIQILKNGTLVLTPFWTLRPA